MTNLNASTTSSKLSTTIARDFDRLRERFTNDDFLNNRGLANEVGFYVYPYDASRELEVRQRTAELVAEINGSEPTAKINGSKPAAEANGPELAAKVNSPEPTGTHTPQSACHIIERNLWQVFLQICENKRILNKIPSLEAKRGSDALLARMQKIATPEVFARTMDYEPHQPGRDILLITGVGQVYPFVRAHAILENAQSVFEDIPVVLLYPGRFDGQHLHLFDRINDGNYYRAFNIL